MQIQTILITPTFKNEYYKEDKGKVSKISKETYFRFYDKSFSDKSIKVLPPLTKVLR